MDVKTAFLNGKLLEDVYMTQPEGFVDAQSTGKVCEVQLSIYGLKQASKSWNLRFDDVIKEFSFIKNKDEPCVYKKVSGSAVIFLVLYVDDILLIENDIPFLQSVNTWLGRCFSKKDLGEATYVLDDNLANPLTKPLVQRKHKAHTRSLGIREMPIGSSASGRLLGFCVCSRDNSSSVL
ncbi:hypothetical protein CRG98_016536 [Punica granatum]|uniref:Reverse transcriptase Ty1/copia-type domain-containing protein n=1 Tax=Punica granatum TaxID=22663 RepID=A0A2I0K3F5_PUNGR|nr:hypothetical protein CRG98_016536 [Punica granatum]